MSRSIVPCRAQDLEVVRGLISDSSLADEFWTLLLPGTFEDLWRDPFADADLRWLALEAGVPVGFLFTLVLPGARHHWATLRLGVLGSHRRRGIGSELLSVARAELAAKPSVRELCLSAWAPCEGAAGFAAHHGFAHARTYWKMSRPLGNPPVPVWPAGIETRVYDGSDQALRDFHEAYSTSFAEHYHYVASTLEHARASTRQSSFRPDGLLLAYRDGRCVGYSRNAIRGHEGEVALIGVVREARGIGLGRALLRWGAAWLEHAGCVSVELGVDGENDNATALYRSESFVVDRSREIWSRS